MVLERDGQACVWCGRSVLAICYSLHHRIPRGAGGSTRAGIHSPANLVVLCGTGSSGCHGFLEEHPRLARETGFRLSKLTALDASEVPVLAGAGSPAAVWMLLAHDGSRIELFEVGEGVTRMTREEEQRKYLEEVARKAAEDQRRLEQYEQSLAEQQNGSGA